MPRNQTAGNLALAGYDDIFNVGKIHEGECVVEIPLAELHPPDFHPFLVNHVPGIRRVLLRRGHAVAIYLLFAPRLP